MERRRSAGIQLTIIVLLAGVVAACLYLLHEYESFPTYIAVVDRLLAVVVIIIFGDWFYGMFD